MRQQQQGFGPLQIPGDQTRIPGQTKQLGRGQANATQAPVPIQGVDLSALSPTLKKMSEEKGDFLKEAEINAGVKVAELVQQNKTQDEIITALNDGKTPAQIAAKITRMIKSGGLKAIDAPNYKIGYQNRMSRFRVDETYVDHKSPENFDRWTDLMANADPGEPRSVIQAQILQEIAAENEKRLGDLGYYGALAAEDRIATLNEQLLEDIAKGADVKVRRRMWQATDKEIGDEVAKYVDTTFVEGVGYLPLPEEAEAHFKALGAQFDQMRAESRPNAPQDFEDHIKGAEARIAAKFGHKAAQEYLEQAVDMVATAQGYRPLRDGAGDQIESRIAMRQRRAEEGIEETSIKRGASRKNALLTLQGVDWGQKLILLGNDGPAAVQEYAASLMEDFQNGDLDLSAFPEDERPYVLSAIQDEAKTAMSYGQATTTLDTDTMRNTATALMHAGQFQEAREAVAGSPAKPEARLKMIAEIERYENSAEAQVTPEVMDRSYYQNTEMIAVLATSPTGDPKEADPERLALAQNRMEEIAHATISEMVDPGRPGGPAKHFTIKSEILKRIREEFPSIQKVGGIPVTAIKPMEGETVTEARVRVESQAGAPERRGDLFADNGKVTLAGLSNEEMDKLESPGIFSVNSVRALENTLAGRGRIINGEPVARKDFTGGYADTHDIYGNRVAPRKSSLERTMLDAFTEFREDTKLPPKAQAEVVGQALAISGKLSSASLAYMILGEQEAVVSTFQEDMSKAGVQSETFASDLIGPGATLKRPDIFRVMVSDFRDAQELFTTVSNSVGTLPVLNRKTFTKERRAAVTFLLSAAGYDPDSSGFDDVIKNFLQAQAYHWSK